MHADESPDEVIALVLEGTGFGHGRGMSQWGAYGYAVDHGWDWRQILDHYYGGTNHGTVSAGQRINVRLTPYDGMGDITFISHGSGVTWNGVTAPSMRVVESATGRFDVYRGNTIACPGATSMTVPDGPVLQGATNNSDVRLIQSFLKSFQSSSIGVDGSFGPQTASTLASWQSSRGLPVDGSRWDGDDAAAARSQIGASGSGVTWSFIGQHTQSPGSPVRLTTAGGDSWSTSRNSVLGVCAGNGSVRHYRGALQVVDSENGNRVVNDVSVENYLRGVVPKEISASWASAGGGAGANSVRAQSVAARSYGLSENRTGNSYEYRGSSVQFATTCDTTSCQVYAGAATRSSALGSPSRVEQDATDAAISATANVVRKWPSGAVVRTEFSASNGPRTAGGAFPPVDDIGDDTTRNPNHRWTRVLDAHAIAASYGLGTVTAAYMTEAQSSTYDDFDGIWFNDLVIEGTRGTERWQAWDFRNEFDLRSPGFTVRAITRDTAATTFALIGDSVSNSIAHSGDSELRRLLDGTFVSARYDVQDARCTVNPSCRGTSGIEAAQQVPRGTDLVVVALGYNDDPSTFDTAVDTMMQTLRDRDVAQVVWVNMAEIRRSSSGSFYGPANSALQAAQGRWSELTVVDWNAQSDTAERDRWFTDGVHLTVTGQAEFAVWLRDEIVGAAPSHYLSPPERIVLPVVGQELTTPDGSTATIPENATGVALNVTVVRPAQRGFATVWPCASERPFVSSLNYEAGDTLANSIIAPVDPDGTVCLYSSQGTHLVVDAAGWFDGPIDDGDSFGATNGPFVGVSPVRLVDTRDGTGGRTSAVTPTSPLAIPIAGRSLVTAAGATVDVPADVAAVSLNVGVVRPDRNGFVTVWPCGVDRPLASNVNFDAGAIVSNGVVAPVGDDGRVCIHVEAVAEVVVDLAGFFDGTIPSNVVADAQGIASLSSGDDDTTDPATTTTTTTTTTPPDTTAPDTTVPTTTAPETTLPETTVPTTTTPATTVPVEADPVDLPTTPAFRATVPTRLADTRPAEGGSGVVQPSEPLVVQVRGAALTDPSEPGGAVAVPDDATAVALNLAVVQAQAKGFATVWPCSADRPLASNVNFSARRNISNAVVAPIGTDGTVCVFVDQPAHLVVDVAGWFRGGDQPSFVGAVPERLVDTRIAVGPLPV
ncbi:MAG: SpoIID/LytB domain-containing protein [Actinomycetota bacterium]